MTAFVPIPAREAAEIVKAGGVPHAREVLVTAAAAGLVKAYADAIQIFDTKGNWTTTNGVTIPVDLWLRMMNAEDVDHIWTTGAVRLPGSDLVGGIPRVHVTGVGFKEASLRTLIASRVRQAAVAAGRATNEPPPRAGPDRGAAAGNDQPASEPATPKRQPRRSAGMSGIPAGAITVTVNEAIAITGLGRTTIDKLMGEGRLERRKVGGRTLITVASIRALLGSDAATADS